MEHQDEDDKARSPDETYVALNEIGVLPPIRHSFSYLGMSSVEASHGVILVYQCPSCGEDHHEVLAGFTPSDCFANAVDLLKEIQTEFHPHDHD